MTKPDRNMANGNERKKNRMFNINKESFEWGGRTLTLETGKIARQADGSVLATYGETVVLATVVGAPNPKEAADGHRSEANGRHPGDV